MPRIAVLLGALVLLGAACSPMVPPAPEPNGNSSGPRATDQVLSTVNATNAAPITGDTPVLRTAIVKLTASGVDPVELSVVPGTIVAFVNEDTIPHRMGPPEGTGVPEGFGSGPASPPGETYTFTFPSVGRWTYRDLEHPLEATYHGTVVVHTP